MGLAAWLPQELCLIILIATSQLLVIKQHYVALVVLDLIIYNVISELSYNSFSYCQSWTAAEANPELLSDAGIPLTSLFLMALLTRDLPGEYSLLVGLAAVHNNIHSSMPTSLNLLILSSTICHSNSDISTPLSISYQIFLVGAILVENLYHFLGSLTGS